MLLRDRGAMRNARNDEAGAKTRSRLGAIVSFLLGPADTFHFFATAPLAAQLAARAAPAQLQPLRNRLRRNSVCVDGKLFRNFVLWGAFFDATPSSQLCCPLGCELFGSSTSGEPRSSLRSGRALFYFPAELHASSSPNGRREDVPTVQ